jgi:hypothetical protein
MIQTQYTITLHLMANSVSRPSQQTAVGAVCDRRVYDLCVYDRRLTTTVAFSSTSPLAKRRYKAPPFLFFRQAGRLALPPSADELLQDGALHPRPRLMPCVLRLVASGNGTPRVQI